MFLGFLYVMYCHLVSTNEGQYTLLAIVFIFVFILTIFCDRIK